MIIQILFIILPDIKDKKLIFKRLCIKLNKMNFIVLKNNFQLQLNLHNKLTSKRNKKIKIKRLIIRKYSMKVYQVLINKI